MPDIRHIAETGQGPLLEARLSAGGATLSMLNYGAVTRDWRVARNGADHGLILGYEDPLSYLSDDACLGAIVGRIANRTRPTDDWPLTPNEGEIHLHGGPKGLGRRLWRMEASEGANRLRLCYHSPDGEEGYPGAADFTVDVTLEEDRLIYEMHAVVDRPTPVNLAQHNYYNLAGKGDIWDHGLTCIADRYLPLLPDGIPRGDIASVTASGYDYRMGAVLGERVSRHLGSDINLVFPKNRNPGAPAAILRSPDGAQMHLITDQPGLQLYTATHLTSRDGGLDGASYAPFSGICLEPQMFPDALNQPQFAAIIATPERPYRQRLELKLGET